MQLDTKFFFGLAVMIFGLTDIGNAYYHHREYRHRENYHRRYRHRY